VRRLAVALACCDAVRWLAWALLDLPALEKLAIVNPAGRGARTVSLWARVRAPGERTADGEEEGERQDGGWPPRLRYLAPDKLRQLQVRGGYGESSWTKSAQAYMEVLQANMNHRISAEMRYRFPARWDPVAKSIKLKFETCYFL
jgi:hypothetical protein